MDAIKYCPHCGGEARLTANYSPKTKLWFIQVKCVLCGATGKVYTQAEDPEVSDWETDACIKALYAWNKRYNPELDGTGLFEADSTRTM